MDLASARAYADQAMPAVIDDLTTLVAHPSIAFPGYPREPMDAIVPELLDLFRRNGVEQVETLDVPGGYPAIYALVPGPQGSPTVTLYAHYDVQPAPMSQGWTTDPWTATTKADGRLYGRGAADCKAGVVAIAATMGAFEGTPPCTVRLVIEGEEETSSHIEELVQARPELFASDVFVICDGGNEKVGEPAIGTGLRGDVALTVTLRSLDSALHSGAFGGGAPDALVAMIQLLATLHDAEGNTVVEGLHSFEWEGGSVDEDEFRSVAGVVGDAELVGSGPLASRLWSRPSVTVLGMDVPTVAGSSNALVPTCSARLSLRIAPGSDMEHELETLKEHLRTHTPYGLVPQFTDEKMGAPFLADTSGPAVAAAATAMGEAFGAAPAFLGSGGSIPLVSELIQASPGAEAIVWGPEDSEKARIHGPDESVDPSEIRDIVVAQIRLLTLLGEGAR
ncbi:M20/M25/M40 family metallo-hydrolase [Arsenicicoccus piscis]|uniref:Dipeptidase n=1 Tax=Arsenicicoccus piscis TaxID=673954 RepID=A0ABQ6HMZ5_9MICO|nr:M20/M25/M40 family metallo-hydrolase [Arsenicicoccus piscis]MCH8629297.1 M20/M25/M40 family metallo-hydrolase [Arsenicicoccus piscis]GMA19741.1 dipeptidase [Arsenicicoccus piscis]GMA22037.1 dipeptidase [Arsenicicoccus piscis]